MTDITQQNEPLFHRVYIAVPYADRKAASAKHAIYDSAQQAFYVDTRQNTLDNFQKWVVDPSFHASEGMGLGTPERDLRAFLDANGAALPADKDVVMDGTKQRVQVEDDKPNQQSGVYVAYLDGTPAGWFSNFRSGKYHKWAFKGEKRPAHEGHALRANAQIASLKRDKARTEKYLAVAESASSFYHAQKPASKNHPYLNKKKLSSTFNAKQTDDGYLILPIVDTDNKIWSIQSISPKGRKMILADSKKWGHFFNINGVEIGKTPFIIEGEGWSTAASIAEDTQMPVIGAVDSSNIPSVTDALLAKQPTKGVSILLAYDDDVDVKTGNVGKNAADKAATKTGIQPIGPSLPENFKGNRDFNDMHVVCGAKAVFSHFIGHIQTYVKKHSIAATPMDRRTAAMLHDDLSATPPRQEKLQQRDNFAQQQRTAANSAQPVHGKARTKCLQTQIQSP